MVPGVAERLVYAIQWQLPAVTFMFVTVIETAAMRWRNLAISPAAPDKGEEQEV